MADKEESPGKKLLRQSAPEFVSEELQDQLLGLRGRTAQAQAFCDLWAIAASKVRMAKQAALGNFRTLDLRPEGEISNVELAQNTLALAQHLMELDAFFVVRHALLGELVKAIRELEDKRPPINDAETITSNLH